MDSLKYIEGNDMEKMYSKDGYGAEMQFNSMSEFYRDHNG